MDYDGNRTLYCVFVMVWCHIRGSSSYSIGRMAMMIVNGCRNHARPRIILIRIWSHENNSLVEVCRGSVLLKPKCWFYQ